MKPMLMVLTRSGYTPECVGMLRLTAYATSQDTKERVVADRRHIRLVTLKGGAMLYGNQRQVDAIRNAVDCWVVDAHSAAVARHQIYAALFKGMSSAWKRIVLWKGGNNGAGPVQQQHDEPRRSGTDGKEW